MNYVTVRRPNTRLSVASDFDRLFESVFRGAPDWNESRPAVDIRNLEDRYAIEADLPGLSEDQIDVRVENDLLVISSREEQDRSAGSEEKSSGEFLIRERRVKAYYRSFALPKDADAGNIEAAYRNGVLSVNLHKKPEAKPRQIEIKRG